MSELKFKFKMPDDESLAGYISVKGEKGDKGDPTKLSELENDTGFVTTSTDALVNYYTKSQTDTALGSKVDNSTLEAIAIPDSFFIGEETIAESGTFIELENTAYAVLKEVKFYGDTQQDGTPTPENPVDVQVVTGDQTIIITDDDQQSQNYTVSLGDIELCNIQGYRDYIYYNNGAWYLHKETDSYTFTGDSSTDLYEYNTDGTNNVGVNLKPKKVDLAAFRTTSGAVSVIYSDKFIWSSGINNEGIYLTGASQVEGGYNGNIRLYIAHSRLEDYSSSLTNAEKVTLVRDWIASNNLTVYFIRNRSQVTDEEITDNKLVKQLEAVRSAHSYNGITVAIASGQLSAVLSIEVFTNNWRGTTSGIANNFANIAQKVTDTEDDIDTSIKVNIVDNLEINNFVDLVYSADDLYEGGEHFWLQGLCVAEGNIIMALRNEGYKDDYVRLVEYNPTALSVVREKYLELMHANALSYDKENRIIYVAACNHVNNGSAAADNRIFAVDYESLEINETITVTNVPANHRIRSVSYDNYNKVLYAGDVTTVFKLDLSTSTIVETIDLDTSNIDTDITNQTYTIHGDLIYGLFITFIAVWNFEGELVKTINIKPDEGGGVHTGEPEDLDFIGDSGDFILGCSKSYSPRLSNRVTSLFRGNFYTNTANARESEIVGADSSNMILYVNANSAEAKENGTSAYPYKSLQRAIGVTKRYGKGTDVRIAAGTYDYTYLNQMKKVVFVIQGAVTINGLELRSSDLLVSGDGSSLTINNLKLYDKSYFRAANSVINANGSYAIEATNTSTIHLSSGTITGDNAHDAVSLNGNCRAVFTYCTIDGYSGHYAIRAEAGSSVSSYSNTFSIPASSSQALYRINSQSEIEVDPRSSQSSYAFSIAGQGRKTPSILNVEGISPVYIGDICALHYAFTNAQIKLKIAGTNSSFKTVDIDLLDAASDGIRIDTVYPNSSGIRVGSLNISVANNKLKVTNPKMAFYGSNGTYTFEDITETPQSTQNYAAVVGVKFFNK